MKEEKSIDLTEILIKAILRRQVKLHSSHLALAKREICGSRSTKYRELKKIKRSNNE